MRTLGAIALSVVVFGASLGAARAEETKVIKFATLAPEGS